MRTAITTGICLVAFAAVAGSVFFDPTLYRLFSEGERAATQVGDARCLAHDRGAEALKRGPKQVDRHILEGESVLVLRKIHERQRRLCRKYLMWSAEPATDARLLAAWKRIWVAGADIAELAALLEIQKADPSSLADRAEEDARLAEETRDAILENL